MIPASLRRGCAALVVTALVVVGEGSGSRSAEAGVPVPEGDELFVVHDSVVINARATIRHKLADWDIEYLGFHGMQAWAGVQFLDRRRRPIPDTVLVSLNFNNRSREQLRIDLTRLLDRLAPAERIIWVLPAISGPHLVFVRETMLEVVAGDPRVEVIDWHEHYRTDENLVDIFGVHLTELGAWVYATMIDRVLDRAPAGDPPSVGRLGAVRSNAAGEMVSGWALDLESSAPRRVDVYVDGERRRRVRADRPRQDVAAAYGLGAEHGFRARFGADDGVRRICALTATGAGRGMQSLGCTLLTVRHDPLATMAPLERDGESVTMRGWAFDPDRAESIGVHAYVDGTFAGGGRADRHRLDVAAVYPGRTHTGFEVRLPVASDAQELCVFAIGVGRGGNRSLGCHPIPVP
ncbi:MAG: hypothetical protein ACR2QE_11005 [Acidimicrobiales bacterium]